MPCGRHFMNVSCVHEGNVDALWIYHRCNRNESQWLKVYVCSTVMCMGVLWCVLCAFCIIWKYSASWCILAAVCIMVYFGYIVYHGAFNVYSLSWLILRVFYIIAYFGYIKLHYWKGVRCENKRIRWRGLGKWHVDIFFSFCQNRVRTWPLNCDLTTCNRRGWPGDWGRGRRHGPCQSILGTLAGNIDFNFFFFFYISQYKHNNRDKKN